MYGMVAVVVSRLVNSKWAHFSLFGLITLYILRKLRERALRNKIQSVYRSQIELAQKERDESIEWARKETALVNDVEKRAIEGMDFKQLRESLHSGKVTAESAVRVYYGLALKAHEKTNCLTGNIKEALNAARELDATASDPSYKKPRLFGIPISIKESIELEGRRNTWGLAKLVDAIPTEDSYQVMVLKKDGAIPFCQTNIPTTCISYTCANSIYGTSTNPHSSSRTCGGSSGGEGALIASGGSLIGLGSDLGGSIRVPAAFSGCCGFKPSATRCSTLQLPEPLPMRPMLMMTAGPLARDPHAIVEVMRSTWSDQFMSNKDPFNVPVDFREDLFKEGRKYRIGYYTSDGYIDPLPGNQRVVREAAELLRAKGHELVPFTLGDIATECARGVWATIFVDNSLIAERIKNEPLPPVMAQLRTVLALPLLLKRLVGRFFQLRGDTNTADFFLSQSSAAIDMQAGIDRIYACRKRLVQKMKDEKIDLLLCPSTIAPAMPHSLPTDMPYTALLTTVIWNAMDFPAGVVTTGSWTEQDERALESYPAKGMVEKGIKRGCKNSVGFPLSVQIVAPAYRDEMVLRAMVDLYEAVKREETTTD